MTTPRDGTFELFYRRGSAYLAVSAPQADGRPVYHEDVINRMRILGIPRVSEADVRAIVNEAAGLPVELVSWPDGARLASAITVTVSEDEMTASISVTAPRKGAAAPERDDLRDALRAAGVVFGVDEQALGSIVSEGRYSEDIEIARGHEPVHARSARIVYHFDPARGKPYLVMEFDRINLRELNFIENRDEGDLLAELAPAVAPRDGVNVRGVHVPARTEVSAVELRAGANTTKSDDGTKLFAASDGNVRLVKDAVTIEPVVSVEHVNYETGNIRFEGSVVVEKDVADGFVIEADGDVQVGRGVGRATIRAGGNVLLKAGMNGAGEGVIEADGNVFAKYLEAARVTSHANVFVEEAIMHSHVTLWKHCVLNGRRSEIIASNLVVGGSVWCKKLGSVAEAPVFVAIGVDPEMLATFRAARGSLDAAESRLDEAQREFEQIDHALMEGKTDDRLYETREALLAEVAELKESLPAIRHRVHELRENLQASRESRLVVEDTIFKGAVVLFGTQEYHAPDRGARKTVLRRGAEGIVEEGFNPSDRPAMPFDE